MTAPLGPHAAKVLPRLKDFQRASVDYAFRRMYQDNDLTTRFLVADEVGLGKTMVARGLIARVLDELDGKVDRIDVVYVCSNSAIARQNVNKLAMKDGGDVVLSSRITLLPMEAHRLRDNSVNLISFTPATSFELHSSLGISDERVLLFHLLKRAWGTDGADVRNVLRGGVSKSNFRTAVHAFPEHKLDGQLATDFIEVVAKELEAKAELEALTIEFGRAGQGKLRQDLSIRRRNLIGGLRDLLAKVCLRALEPDLIILDEFQRFRHLLSTDDDESLLARELFEYSDEQTQARVLLLSATPYKMYTEPDEADGQDHYQDFLATIEFLQRDPARTARTRQLLEEYRLEWLRMDPGFETRVKAVKRELENELKRVMVRTERLAVTPNRDGMLTTVPCAGIRIEPREALTYRYLGRIAEAVDQADPIEYWKSAPYLLSFMEEYKLKARIVEALADPEQSAKIGKELNQHLPLLLPWDDVERYRRIDPGNARLRWLIDRAVGDARWKLLWIPPCRPWYRLGGPFADPDATTFTKLLVFSGWKVVPKTIAALVSYEAERRMMEAGGNQENTLEARRRFRPLLRANQEALFTLTYPSFSLARLAAEVAGDPAARSLSPDEVLARVTARVEEKLATLPPAPAGGQPDLSWYWAAPAILDWQEDSWASESWFRQEELNDLWGDPTEAEDESGLEGMRLQALYGAAKSQGGGLGARPADLAQVVALAALAGPATAALRALTAVLGGEPRLRAAPLRNAAARIGWGLRGYYNLPEVNHLLRGTGKDAPYWQLVLRYGLDGCIGAVLGEYVHVLNDWLGLNDHDFEDAAAEIADAAVEALGIRTASLSADHFVPGPDDDGAMARETRRLRSRYAARLADEKGEDEKDANRADQVRVAFNSPFWPFVLATTSVGQEGLDFHLYCHAVVHWNLPSNPVDLEQREGRVHRYKGHAIRKNVALDHGGDLDGRGLADSWLAMFEAAGESRPADVSEIWPFWIYPADNGAAIERHVPALPLSRDVTRLRAVQKMAALYRLAFGQMRQEDLVSAIARITPTVEPGLLIDLHPQ